MALAGGDAEYHALYAEHLEGTGADPDPQFLLAASLSPLDARYWIRLGFSAEAKGNYSAAERYLLKAASVNSQFDPPWALMNFYFRRGNSDQFWYWADKAIKTSYGDISAIHRLLWDVSSDPDLVLSHIPRDRAHLNSYLYFLEINGHGNVAGPVAARLALESNSNDVPILQHYCQEAAASRPESALSVWNSLCARRLLQGDRIDVQNATIIGDPSFRMFRDGEGFGWHFQNVEGLVTTALASGAGVHVALSGSQPEDFIVAEAVLPPLETGIRYRIQVQAMADPGSALAGLGWQILTIPDARVIADQAAWTRFSASPVIEFRAATAAPLRLRLQYRRPLGSTRARGGLTISSVRSGLVP